MRLAKLGARRWVDCHGSFSIAVVGLPEKLVQVSVPVNNGRELHQANQELGWGRGLLGAAMKLAAVRKFAMSLPEVTEEPHHEYSSFRVRGKIFVTVPPDEEFIHVFVSEQEREQALAVYSDFVEKLLWGGKARGLKVRLSTAEVSAVKRLVREAWEHRAPKALATGAPAQGAER